MRKFMRAFLVLALVLAFVAPVAFAETQNVKVSGSIDAYWFYRSDYNLAKTTDGNVLPTGSGATATPYRDTSVRSTDNFFMTQTQIEIAADLTDNVSTVVNLVNERDWNNATAGSGSQFDVEVDLAYVQMKEIFYSPLTLKIGRQDLWWGRGFVLGNNQSAWDSNGTISAAEYSVQTAFDAVRATLDFNPWTIDAIYSKIAGNSVTKDDDQDLYGVNVSYKFAEYNAVAEGYFLSDLSRQNVNYVVGEKASDTETLGARVQFDPISQITLGAEGAYQFGNYENNFGNGVGLTNKKNIEAFAADIFATYRFDLVWKPDLTLEYVYLSGQKNANVNDGSNYTAWSSPFRGRFYTAIEDFRGWVYPSAGQIGTGNVDAGSTSTSGANNSEMIQVKANIKPMDDLLLTGSYSYFWSPEKDYLLNSNGSTASTLSNSIGNEFDAQATYDYTEDVTFGLLLGWFIPGDKFSSPNDRTATDIVASTKVTF